MSKDSREKKEAPLPVDRIVSAATEVFGQFGFAKATIQDIVAAAQVSKPLFYRRYANKQAIFERVVEQVLSDWREALVDVVAETPGGAEAELRVLFLDSLAYGRNHSFIGRLITRDTQVLIASESDVTQRAVAALDQVIAKILERGVEAGEIREDLNIPHMADFMTEIHFAYANRQLLTGVPVAGQLAEDVVEGMLRAVRLEYERD